jgi:hypothetical protein
MKTYSLVGSELSIDGVRRYSPQMMYAPAGMEDRHPPESIIGLYDMKGKMA